MPPLWPHAPLWPFDPEVKRQVLQQLGPLNQGGLAEFMTHNYVQQRTLDARWAHMLHLKDEEEDSPAQPAVHWSERILKQSGWVLQDHLLASFGDGNITAEEFVSQCARSVGSGMDLAPEYTKPTETIRRRCGFCKAKCISECMCGEPYCSRDCQRKDWKEHRRLCETVFDNNQLAWPLTQIEFAKIHNADMARALGQGPTSRAECRIEDNTCAKCGTRLTKAKRCAKCKAVCYCSKECQTLHWKLHKKRCATLANAQHAVPVDV
eukprot:CAMPEP_0174289234 /NCGR_PEP_ID=MMETSP0809-20121228/24217_1 /TAXON_ID=73025 ORGANISM="Eutreptiella gymnastica-like, Strain CCMP1594" /NCGR_SAMPLE_ID=MMETSP0809 /ASSEMBLY_ACC=CAM_ASM_000658 /LENGTH=264 /DNA_ID=CAMNT_0015387065 /DNA_START=62 /DNA_END=856 /DNA_ORIENTATION=+